jgi:hypothetical protein
MRKFGRVRASGVRTGNGNMRRRGFASGSRNLRGNIRRSTYTRASGFRSSSGLRPRSNRLHIAKAGRMGRGHMRVRSSLRIL